MRFYLKMKKYDFKFNLITITTNMVKCYLFFTRRILAVYFQPTMRPAIAPDVAPGTSPTGPSIGPPLAAPTTPPATAPAGTENLSQERHMLRQLRHVAADASITGTIGFKNNAHFPNGPPHAPINATPAIAV